MKTVPLGEVCTVTMGQAPPGDSYNDQRIGIPLIAGAGDFSGTTLRTTKFTTAPTRISEPGDIILSIRASIGAKVWADGQYCLGRGVAGLRANEKILDSRYLWHWLSSIEKELVAKGKGATFLQVNRGDIEEIPFSLIEVSEQRRIAAILDQADALRAKRRQVLAHLDALTQSIFQDMFGSSPLADERPLSAVATITSGITKGRRTSEPTFSTPYLAVSNVQAGQLTLHMVKEIPATKSEIQRYALADGDLVLTEGGDPDKLGRGTVWRSELPLCLHQNHIFRVRINDRRTLLPEFLAGYLNDPRAKRYFLRSAKQTTGIASINMTQLKALPVPIPAITEQRIYLERRQAIELQTAATKHAAATVDALFTSLQARAFRGEL